MSLEGSPARRSKPVALKMVWQLAGKTKLPLIGMGGIMTAEDAIEFMIVGASAVQVGTANFRDPSATMSVLDGMEAYFKRHRLSGVEDIVGTFRYHCPSMMDGGARDVCSAR